MPYPSTVAQIEARTRKLAADYPQVCSCVDLGNRTHEGTAGGQPGRLVPSLVIGRASGGGRPRILIVGGIHAREWAPPDAILTFLEKLLAAHKVQGAMTYRRFDDRRSTPPLPYLEFRIGWPTVERIVERTELYVVPCANPDGRAYTMTTRKVGWRKNRAPAPPGAVCTPIPAGTPERIRRWMSDDPRGVDLNRNFNIGWNLDTYYSAAAAPSVGVSTVPCDHSQTYHGQSAASEPETRNIQVLLDDKGINFYMDVHSFARKFLVAWGMEDVQEVDPAKTFHNADYNRGGSAGERDAAGASYAEWMPPGRDRDQRTLGQALVDAVLDSTGYTATDTSPTAVTARANSEYETESSVQFSGYLTGVSRDYAFARQIGFDAAAKRATARDPVFSYTLECGHLTDGGFQPHATREYPKIEREVGAALARFLDYAATWRAPVPVVPPPAPPPPIQPPPQAPPPGVSDSTCMLLAVALGSRFLDGAMFLRELRKVELTSTPLARRFLQVVTFFYDRVSARVAAAARANRFLRWGLRYGFLAPVIAATRGAEKLVGGVEAGTRRVDYFVVVVTAGALTAGAGVLYFLGRVASGIG